MPPSRSRISRRRQTAIDRTVTDQALTVLHLPTAYWHELMAWPAAESWSIPRSVRLARIAGEQALTASLTRWHERVQQPVRLVNIYGPTETTIGATACDLRPLAAGERIPIGLPLPNTRVYLIALWLECLPVESVDRLDDFFDLGGHSLLAMRLAARLYEAFGLEVPVSTIFDAPTVAMLASVLSEEAASGRESLPILSSYLSTPP